MAVADLAKCFHTLSLTEVRGNAPRPLHSRATGRLAFRVAPVAARRRQRGREPCWRRIRPTSRLINSGSGVSWLLSFSGLSTYWRR